MQSLEQTPALQTLKMSIGVARASKPPYVLWESGVPMCWIGKVTPAKVTAVFFVGEATLSLPCRKRGDEFWRVSDMPCEAHPSERGLWQQGAGDRPGFLFFFGGWSPTPSHLASRAAVAVLSTTCLKVWFGNSYFALWCMTCRNGSSGLDAKPWDHILMEAKRC